MKSLTFSVLLTFVFFASVKAEPGQPQDSHAKSDAPITFPLLFEDIKAGNTTMFNTVIGMITDINHRLMLSGDNGPSGTLLHAAVLHDQPEAVKFLLENGADTEARTNMMYSALYFAANNDNFEIVDMLIDHGCNIYADAGFRGNLFAEHNISQLSRKMRDHLLDVKKRHSIKQVAAWVPLINFSENLDWTQKTNCLEKLNGYLRDEKDTSGTDREGNTLLHYLAKENLRGKNYIQRLVDTGNLDINAANIYGKTALHLACRKDRVENAKSLISLGADVNARDYNNNTPLITLGIYFESGHTGDMEEAAIAKLLIENGADVNAQNVFGISCLHKLARERRDTHVKFKKILIDAGADANLKNNESETSLHEALRYGTATFVKELLEAGADPGAVNSYKQSAIDLAIRKGQAKIDLVFPYLKSPSIIQATLCSQEGYVEKLVLNGGDIEYVRPDRDNGATALIIASQRNNAKMVKKLLELKANINAVDTEGNTALHYSAKYGMEDALWILLDSGADIELKNNAQQTSFDLAELNNKFRSIQLFKDIYPNIKISERKAEPEEPVDPIVTTEDPDITEEMKEENRKFKAATEKEGKEWLIETFLSMTDKPLHTAVIKGDIDEVKKLIENGDADINETDSKGVPPIGYATILGNEEMLKVLIDKGADISQLGITEDPDITEEMKEENRNFEAEMKKERQELLIENFISMTDKPLHTAVIKGDIEEVKQLIENGDTDIKKTDRKGLLPIGYATVLGDKEMLKLLLDKGADINQLDKNTSLYEVSLHRGVSHAIGHKGGFGVMHYVAVMGDLEMFEFMVKHGADLDIADVENHNSPMLIAYSSRDAKMIKALAKAGADIKYRNSAGRSVMTIAVRNGNMEYMQLMLDLGIKINKGMLFDACSSGKEDLATFLISNGMDVNAVDSKGNNILHHVISHNNLEIIRILIENGIDVNHKNKQGRVPLFCLGIQARSINAEQMANTNLLLEAGADILATNENGDTLIHFALEFTNCSYMLAEFAIKKGVDVNHANNKGITPIMKLLGSSGITCEAEGKGLIKLLLDNGADTTGRDRYKRTLLHHAVKAGVPELMVWLIESGADMEAMDKDMETPLQAAAERKNGGYDYPKTNKKEIVDLNIEIIKTLLDHGADINTQDDRHDTPLHNAIQKKNEIEIIKFLLSAGADASIRNIRGRTPKETAKRNAYKEAYELFQE